MPSRYGAYQPVHLRFQNWGLQKLLLAIAKELQERSGLDLSECFIDGTFVPAKKKKKRSSSAKQSEERAALMTLNLCLAWLTHMQGFP